MQPKHESTIRQLHHHFKTQGQVVFRHSSTDTMRPSLHRVAFDLTDAAGNTLLHLTIEMELDEGLLRSALSAIDPEDHLNILDNKVRMDGFMEAKAFEVIRHLRSFNGMADDYPAIAALVHSVRGAVHAKKFGI